MKKLTRDRVVPIISASVSWLIFAMIGSGRQRLSGQTPFPKEIAGLQKCDHGFLPLLGDNGLLDLAALNVESRVLGERDLPA
jgi:hypothetical protein